MRTHVVELPHGVRPRFPEVCAGCGAAAPDGRLPRSARFAFVLHAIVCTVPMCAACRAADASRRRVREWVAVLGVALAAYAASGLVPAFGEVRAEDWLVRGGVFLVVLLPFAAWRVMHPLPFDLHAGADRVGFEFWLADVAEAFRRANAETVGAAAAVRSRRTVTMLLLAAIVAGVASRAWPFPGVLAEHAGDGLWAAAVFFGLTLVWPQARSRHLGWATVGIAAIVEFSQCLDWQWLVAVRSTRPGALLLGQGFLWADVIAYACGVVLAVVGDATFLPRYCPAPRVPDRLPDLPPAGRA
jgi:hypothetical protein